MLARLAEVCLSLSTWATIPPVIIGTFRYTRLSRECRVIYFFTLAACITEIVSYGYAYAGINNLYLLHIYTIAEFSLLSLFYHYVFKKIFSFSPLLIIAGLFTCMSIVNSVWWQQVITFNSYMRGIEAILLVVYALTFLYGFFFQPEAKHTISDPLFLINAGLLFYFSGASLLFILSNYLLTFNMALQIKIWGLHALLCILMYGLISIGLWKNKVN